MQDEDLEKLGRDAMPSFRELLGDVDLGDCMQRIEAYIATQPCPEIELSAEDEALEAMADEQYEAWCERAGGVLSAERCDFSEGKKCISKNFSDSHRAVGLRSARVALQAASLLFSGRRP